jgi:hypothetical protein
MGLVINVDKIEKIYVNKARQAKYIRYNKAEREIRKFFGLIKVIDAVEAHWSGYWGEKYQSREELIKANSCSTKYFINDEVLYENSIWEKPHLYIIMSNSENVTTYYDSIEEMNDKLNETIEQSNKNLMVITE